jgi:hypothetical protein
VTTTQFAERRARAAYPHDGAAPVSVSVISVSGDGSDDSSELEAVAAKEARRYLSRLLQCPVTLHRFRTVDAAAVAIGALSSGSHSVVLSTRDHTAIHDLLGHQWNQTEYVEKVSLLEQDDSHFIQTVNGPSGQLVTSCVGGTRIASLYCVYSLCEKLGARFYISGDVLPPTSAPASQLPAVGEHDTFVPLFKVRGLQPFHDFPMVSIPCWTIHSGSHQRVS